MMSYRQNDVVFASSSPNAIKLPFEFLDDLWIQSRERIIHY